MDQLREALAAAIERRRKVEERLNRIDRAEAKLSDEQRERRGAMEAAEELVAEAKKVAPAATVARLLGEHESDIPSVDDAEAILADAQRKVDAGVANRQTLEAARRDEETKLVSARAGVTGAIAALLSAAPETRRVLDELTEAEARVRDIRGSLYALHAAGADVRIPPIVTMAAPNVGPGFETWSAACRGLQQDPNMPLPGASGAA